MNKFYRYYTYTELEELVAKQVETKILPYLKGIGALDVYLSPVIRGGVPVALMIQQELAVTYGIKAELTNDLSKAVLVVDDLVDSGHTRQSFETIKNVNNYDYEFFALFEKTEGSEWVVFPWETQEKAEDDTIIGTLRNRALEASSSKGTQLFNFVNSKSEHQLLIEEQGRRLEAYEKSIAV